METTIEPMVEMKLHNLTKGGVHIHPTMAEYYTHLTPFITLAIFIGSLLFLLNLSIFLTTMMKLRKQLNKPLLNITLAICSLYPIIGLAALITILVPKSWLICHTLMHLSFTIGAILFHRLCFSYVSSEDSYIKQTDGHAVIIRTPPLCCCCLFLPPVIPSKEKLCFLRYMVWQMPIIQGSVMLTLNAIYYKEPELYTNSMFYFIPFLVGSILAGIWALNITVRMIHTINEELGLMRKMLCLQLILLLCKLQYMLLDSQLDTVDLGGSYPINNTIYKQTYINLLILVEMVFVSMLVQSTYKSSNQTDIK